MYIAKTGSSKPDFNNKVRISLREMRETNYWLRLIRTMELHRTLTEELEFLIDESQHF